MKEEELRRRLNNIERGIYFSSIDGVFVAVFILGISLSIFFGLEGFASGFFFIAFLITLIFWVVAVIENKINERIGALIFLIFLGALIALTSFVGSIGLGGENIFINFLIILIIFLISYKLIDPTEKYLKHFYWSRELT